MAKVVSLAQGKYRYDYDRNLETLRKEQLKDMNADEFQLLFQSDILVL